MARLPPKYFHPPKPAAPSTSSATTADGNLDLGASDAGAVPAASNGIRGAPDIVREIGGTVRERDCPPPVDPRVSDCWLPVRGAGTPPSVGNRS